MGKGILLKRGAYKGMDVCLMCVFHSEAHWVCH